MLQGVLYNGTMPNSCLFLSKILIHVHVYNVYGVKVHVRISTCTSTYGGCSRDKNCMYSITIQVLLNFKNVLDTLTNRSGSQYQYLSRAS